MGGVPTQTTNSPWGVNPGESHDTRNTTSKRGQIKGLSIK